MFRPWLGGTLPSYRTPGDSIPLWYRGKLLIPPPTDQSSPKSNPTQYHQVLFKYRYLRWLVITYNPTSLTSVISHLLQDRQHRHLTWNRPSHRETVLNVEKSYSGMLFASTRITLKILANGATLLLVLRTRGGWTVAPSQFLVSLSFRLFVLQKRFESTVPVQYEIRSLGVRRVVRPSTLKDRWYCTSPETK